MQEVLTAGLVLIVTHFGMSSAAVRPALVRVFGERGFLGVYSLVSLGALSWLIYAYGHAPRFGYAWFADPALDILPKAVMPVACILLLGGFLVKNPTTVGMENLLSGDNEARGLLRITRHPFMWAVVIWSVSHIVVNGDYVSLAFFGTFLVLAGVGAVLIDGKKARKMGADWSRFAAVTSNVPFAAILRGRNRFVPRELLAPVLVGLVGYVLLVFAHEWIAGVPLV
ncbi:MAG: NnrU family protein [Pseudomonadales bacterium]|nr:NnrU family protein [Pseudomonadales bacterium]